MTKLKEMDKLFDSYLLPKLTQDDLEYLSTWNTNHYDGNLK